MKCRKIDSGGVVVVVRSNEDSAEALLAIASLSGHSYYPLSSVVSEDPDIWTKSFFF